MAITRRLQSALVAASGRSKGGSIVPGGRRYLHSSRPAFEQAQAKKQNALLSAELFPLYAIVALAVTGGVYSLSRHFFQDNDIRRLPEEVDEHGKPLPRPEWREVESRKLPHGVEGEKGSK